MAGPEGHKYIITERNKHPVLRAVTLGPENIRPALHPPFPVLPGVGLVDRLAGGAAGLAKYGDLIKRHAESLAVRKRFFALDVPHHGLFHLGNALNVLKRLHVL